MVDVGLQVTPEFYRFSTMADVESFIGSHSELEELYFHDSIMEQLFELIKCRHPKTPLKREVIEEKITTLLNGIDPVSYGLWVFYPWSRNLVHVLPESEFIELRTNRNQYKITPEEQALLGKKKVGIIGLSVGQSVAITMAMERSFGEIHLADFDHLDLSNLNRLRGKISQIGMSKTLICAREILELDPFLKVYIYNEGVDENNIDAFLNPNGKLDLLIEECDGLDIKILARYKAKAYGIPVLMETSDRGLLDIERFDIEPERAILHGLVGDLDPAKLKGLSIEDKVEYLLPMVGLNALSERMKASMLEVQNSIVSWPQLASAVTLGGGVAADLSRKILLKQSTVSGRFYVDLDKLVPEPEKVLSLKKQTWLKPLSDDELQTILSKFWFEPKPENLSNAEKETLLNAAIAAPSGGNCQPWRLSFYKGYLCLIHDVYYSESMLDFNHLGTYVAFGAMVENLRLQAAAMGLGIVTKYFPVAEEPLLVGVCYFERQPVLADLPRVEAIYTRVTNRNIGDRIGLTIDERERLIALANQQINVKLHLVEDAAKMDAMAEILSTAEMLLLLHPQGHHEIFTKELRFDPKEVIETGDGLDIDTLNLSKAEKIAMRIANSRVAMEYLLRIGGGEAFKKTTKKAIAHSSALAVISMPFHTAEAYLHAGEFLEALWLESTVLNLSVQPVTQFSFLLARLKHGNGEGFDEEYKGKFFEMGERFHKILPELMQQEIIFIVRIAKDKMPDKRSLRRKPNKIIFEGTT